MTGWTDGFAELEFADEGQQIGISGPDLTTDACASIEDIKLERISRTIECVGAANQRKPLCRNKLSMIRGAPRCRQV